MVELDEAKTRLQTIEPLLKEAHTTAVENWAKFVKEQPALALPFDATARAQFIHCHVTAEVTRRVDGTPGVEIADALGFFALRVDATILVRFKFVGHGQPSNVATTQQKMLARQSYSDDMMFVLAGDSALTPPTLLTCGYTLDGEKVGRIEIRRDCVGHLPWHYDIYGGTTVVSPTVFDGLEDTAKPATIRKTGDTKKKDDTGEAASA